MGLEKDFPESTSISGKHSKKNIPLASTTFNYCLEMNLYRTENAREFHNLQAVLIQSAINWIQMVHLTIIKSEKNK